MTACSTWSGPAADGASLGWDLVLGPLERIGRVGQGLEFGGGAVGREVGLDRLPESLGRFPERRLAQHAVQRRSDLGRGRARSQAQAGAMPANPGGDVVLVAALRHAEERETVG